MKQSAAFFMAVFIIVLSLLTGCKARERGADLFSEKWDVSKSLVKPEYPVKKYGSDEERWEAERKLQIEDDFCDAVNHFAYETAQELFSREEPNGIYSPMSLYFAMSVAAAGADGQTRQELLNILGYEEEKKLAKDCKGAFTAIYQDKDDYQFQIASSVWIDEHYSVKEEFLEHVKDRYFAEVFQTDFSSENARDDMARWVSNYTHGLLKPSVDQKEGQVLSLIHTIYYKDQWLDQFEKDKTQEGIFTCGDKSKVTCDYMNRTLGSHWFIKGENYTVSGLPLKNGSVEILLPDRGEDLWQFLESEGMLEAVFDRENGESMYGEVVWQIPKFSYGSSYGLEEILKKLGVTAAFSSETADFSGISQEPVWIDSVVQSTHIGIDENGVQAASFTQMDWAGEAMPQGRAEMILDRPFLYVVKDKGCLIFMGICGNPVSDGS